MSSKKNSRTAADRERARQRVERLRSGAGGPHVQGSRGNRTRGDKNRNAVRFALAAH